MGRKVYVGALIVVACAVGRQTKLAGRDAPRRVRGVPLRTVRRWLDWWSTVFVLHRLWGEARGLFAMPVAEDRLPASLLERFDGSSDAALGRVLQFIAPVTTTLVEARNAIGM